MKVLRAIGNFIVFILTGKGELAKEMVDAGMIDYGGQGRDPHGR
jgi:hypothetical protein